MKRSKLRTHLGAARAATIAVLPLIALLLPTTTWAQPPADLQLTPVINSVGTLVVVRHAGDGSGRLFLVEKAGRIWIYDGSNGMSTLPTPFIDLRDPSGPVNDTGGFGERGLLGLAFHPDYTTNGYFYVNYTRNSDPGQTVVERYSVSADPNIADDTSGQIVLVVNQDFGNHNGGNVLFGPDDYLYVGMGDGGSGGDPNNRAQTTNNLLGKMLRIDVNGDDFPADANANYAIPPSNPFVGDPSTRDEIWALGLRNPWRFSFDRQTNDMIIGDVGQNAIEEIDFQPASSMGGENYGWSCREGFNQPNFNSCLPGPLTDPILTYGHSGGNCSVTGGYRYRGSQIGGFIGTYVYADYCTGQVFFGTEDTPGSWSSVLWMNTPYSVSTFGEDEAGELYLADAGGTVYKFISPSSTAIFVDGFESGDTTAWSTTQGRWIPWPLRVVGLVGR